MSLNVAQEVAALQRMTIAELREKYAELFGDETRTGNKTWLVKRLAWRIQALAEGGLSERARARAEELANDADLRLSPPKPKVPPLVTTTLLQRGDQRLPVPGTILTRSYKGQPLQVRVLANGFEYEGEVHKSLSAVAKLITGSHVNGYQFFRLGKDGQ